MSRRILHPTDFSTASAAAFAKAIEMAKAGRGELLLVHVMNPVMPVPGDGYISPKVYDEIAASTKAWGQKQLAKRLVKAKAAGVRAKGFLLEGVPHEQIVRIAKSRRADLVVMGTHGRSGLAKLFIGSVASRVVSAAPCPVLTVRGK
jgi:nucleotide-binding universal stress UspA family protein